RGGAGPRGGADAGIEDVYSTRLSRRTLPKRRVPEREADPMAALAPIRSAVARDGTPRPHPAPAPVTPAGRTESPTPPGSWNPL
ncbi:hypothetical protein CLM83_22250, partial [Streptomyces albidoflavus]